MYETLLLTENDTELLNKIVELEDEVFGEASVGNWNIKPFARYGKVYAKIFTNENGEKEIVSAIEVLSSFDRKLAYIYGVSTNPKFSNKGFATELLKVVLEDLKKENIKYVELTAEIENKIAVHLYEKLDFKVVEILENEYGDNKKRYLMKKEM